MATLAEGSGGGFFDMNLSEWVALVAVLVTVGFTTYKGSCRARRWLRGWRVFTSPTHLLPVTVAGNPRSNSLVTTIDVVIIPKYSWVFDYSIKLVERDVRWWGKTQWHDSNPMNIEIIQATAVNDTEWSMSGHPGLTPIERRGGVSPRHRRRFIAPLVCRITLGVATTWTGYISFEGEYGNWYGNYEYVGLRGGFHLPIQVTRQPQSTADTPGAPPSATP